MKKTEENKVVPAGESKGGGPSISTLNAEQRIQEWVRLVEEGAPLEKIMEAEQQVAEALKAQPFEIKQQLPFFQKLADRLDARKAFREFRLPDGKTVVDRRDEKEGKAAETGKAMKAESRKEEARQMRLKDGKLVREKGRADIGRAAGRGGLEQEAATARLGRFFRLIVERFEEGRAIARYYEGGNPSFLEKSDAQWSSFFKAFFHRTIKKRVKLSSVKDFLFRGLVSKGGKGIVISDLRFLNGRVEKFIRFSILAELVAMFRGLKPGQSFGKGALGELAGDELMYLALAASRGKGFVTSRQEAKGKFMGGRAEALAAQALGISLESQLKEKAKRLKGRGLGLGAFFERDGEPEDIPYRFVPWWHWGNLSKPGKFRWVTVAFYASLLFVGLLGLAVLTYRLIGGG